MLDTTVFNDLLEQKISPSLFAGYHVIATGIQLDELRATPTEETRTSLLNVFEEVAPVPTLTSSFAFDIEGAGFGQAYWNDRTGRFQNMLASLKALEVRALPYVLYTLGERRTTDSSFFTGQRTAE
jgi:hypothetical protein